MKREPERLIERTFDVLVIGAGIYGAWAALDAALRGLSVAVIDRGDFGAATSANNLRVIHGGLRYVQHLDPGRMRESIREQRILMQVAPHLVHPLPCAVPAYGHGLRGRQALRMALLANHLAGLGCRGGAVGARQLPRGRIIDRGRMRQIAPDIADRGLAGGALWHEAQVRDPERLVLAVIQTAAAHGAAAANYVEARELLVERGCVCGARAKDRLDGAELEIRARVTLNLTGPWTDRLLARTFPGLLPALFPPSQAWNLVLRRRLPLECAVGLYSRRPYRDRDRRLRRGSRFLFFVPWREATLIGTSHRPFPPDRLEPEMGHDEAELADLLEEASGAYPAAGLVRGDVVGAFGGLLPGVSDLRTGDVRLVKRPVIRDHSEADGIPGLVTAVGVKFTTARWVAERVIELAVAQLDRRPGECRTRVMPLLPGDLENWERFRENAEARRPATVPLRSFVCLVEGHGKGFGRVLDLACERGSLLDPLADGCSVLGAEVVHAVRHEMAVKLMDVVRRRTDLGKAGLRSDHGIRQAAALMAGELGWEAARREAEIAEVLAAYRPFLGSGFQREIRQ